MCQFDRVYKTPIDQVATGGFAMPRNLRQEFAATRTPGAPWGSEVLFLDTLNSLDELQALKAAVPNEEHNSDLFAYYEETLRRWPMPRLPDAFAERFPLVTARLDTPEKVRVFLRGADFRLVSPATMASVFEGIITQHETLEQDIVVYHQYRDGDEWCAALRIVYHTQLQAWTLTRLLLPGHTRCGVKSDTGLFIDWRPKERQDEKVSLATRPHIGVVAQGTDINSRIMVHCRRCRTTAHAADEATARVDIAKTICAWDCPNCNALRNSYQERSARPQGGKIDQRLHVCPNDGNRWWQSNNHFHLWQQVTSDEEWRVLRQPATSHYD